MVDYRPIPDRRKLFHEYRMYAFAPEQGPPAYDPEEHDTPRALLGNPRGVFADGDDERDERGTIDGDGTDADPRCVCRHYWLEARVRGELHPTAGLAAVATPPEHRRGGYVGTMLERSLEEYRDRGDRFAVLWPFEYAFYRQFGWDTSNRVAFHECEPGELSFATAAIDGEGSFYSVDPDEYDVLDPAYERYAERYALALERDREWWRCRLFENHDTDPFVYAYERDGDVRGYLIYTIDDDPTRDGRTMDVFEPAFADHDALLALLSFCHKHDSQVERVRLRLPADVPLLDIAQRPDAVETTVETGPMVRIVDVAEALSAVSYPDLAAPASITLSVTDPVADWNEGAFALSVSEGRGTCDRVAADAGSDPDPDADAHLDIGALSQLVVGYRSATDLERTGRLETGDSATLETLEALFSETAVYLGDRF
ncbi:GNAT family N-acetyltransferase [Halopiger xanaduensis]|uniref:Acetyltransferase n=1 Tax=Halopiger xanaduensis (strain DSM 18323 / JCM 14033 / SH-6) TaxID=797210 RepID=F8D7F1_HALXS|nr:GNAT family N-acetyltransferase [Halopiger xanaduensis]AEH37871.1 acetyltransferase [Halopiger xanaduensis SH-6]